MGRGTVRCHFPSRQISGWSRHPMWKPAWDSWYTDRGRRIAETCILWLSLSVTTSLPIPSTQTDAGRLNCPAIERSDWKLHVGLPLRFPSVPNLKWKVPSRLNIWILLLLLLKQYRIRLFLIGWKMLTGNLSATQMSPVGVQHTPQGLHNSPSWAPSRPNSSWEVPTRW